MAKTKAQKQEIVLKLEEAFKNATSSVFVHFKGLPVSDESAIRRDFKKEGVRYLVAKKTLILRALASLGHKVDDLALEGEIAIAYGGEGDATVAARLVHAASKKLADKVSIVGGIFEGKIVGMNEMRDIALIPSLDVLRGMFAQVINSPRQRFAVVLSEVAKTKN